MFPTQRARLARSAPRRRPPARPARPAAPALPTRRHVPATLATLALAPAPPSRAQVGEQSPGRPTRMRERVGWLLNSHLRGESTIVCPANTYGLTAGATNCTACPTGSTSSAGSTACTCTAGYSTSGSGASLVCTGTLKRLCLRRLMAATHPGTVFFRFYLDFHPRSLLCWHLQPVGCLVLEYARQISASVSFAKALVSLALVRGFACAPSQTALPARSARPRPACARRARATAPAPRPQELARATPATLAAAPTCRSFAPVRHKTADPRVLYYMALTQSALCLWCTYVHPVCPSNTYSPTAGATSCTACPAGSTSSAGSTGCTCSPGFSSSGSGVTLACTGTCFKHPKWLCCCSTGSRIVRWGCWTRTACSAGFYSASGTTCQGKRPHPDPCRCNASQA